MVATISGYHYEARDLALRDELKAREPVRQGDSFGDRKGTSHNRDELEARGRVM